MILIMGRREARRIEAAVSSRVEAKHTSHPPNERTNEKEKFYGFYSVFSFNGFLLSLFSDAAHSIFPMRKKKILFAALFNAFFPSLRRWLFGSHNIHFTEKR